MPYVVLNGLVVPEGYESFAKGDYGKFPPWKNLDIPVSHPAMTKSLTYFACLVLCCEVSDDNLD